MMVSRPPQDRFSDDAAQAARCPRGGGGWSGHRTLPAVIAVLIATVASARAAEALAPVGRTMASEAAAVRMLSEAIVRAVRDLNQDEDTRPEVHPDLMAGQTHAPAEIAAGQGGDAQARPGGADRLGWHELNRPPPTE